MVAPMMIKEHMEVLGSDGVHVGTVDHLEGQDQMKLTKTDTDADGDTLSLGTFSATSFNGGTGTEHLSRWRDLEERAPEGGRCR